MKYEIIRDNCDAGENKTDETISHRTYTNAIKMCARTKFFPLDFPGLTHRHAREGKKADLFHFRLPNLK